MSLRFGLVVLTTKEVDVQFVAGGGGAGIR